MPKKKTTKRKTKVRVKQKQKQRQSQRVVVYVDRPRARRRTQKRRGRGLPSKPHWRGGVPPEMSSSRTAVSAFAIAQSFSLCNSAFSLSSVLIASFSLPKSMKSLMCTIVFTCSESRATSSCRDKNK